MEIDPALLEPGITLADDTAVTEDNTATEDTSAMEEENQGNSVTSGPASTQGCIRITVKNPVHGFVEGSRRGLSDFRMTFFILCYIP